MNAGFVLPLLELLVATTPTTVHDWTLSVFGWTIGVQEFSLREYSSSVVFLGPFAFRTVLSATSVAIITCGLLMVLLIGMTAVVARTTRRT